MRFPHYVCKMHLVPTHRLTPFWEQFPICEYLYLLFVIVIKKINILGLICILYIYIVALR